MTIKVEDTKTVTDLRGLLPKTHLFRDLVGLGPSVLSGAEAMEKTSQGPWPVLERS